MATNEVENASDEKQDWICSLNTCKALNGYYLFSKQQGGSTQKLPRWHCEVCGTRRDATGQSPPGNLTDGYAISPSTTVSEDTTLSTTPGNSSKSSRKRRSAGTSVDESPLKRSQGKRRTTRAPLYSNDPLRHPRIGHPLDELEIHAINLWVLHHLCRVKRLQDQCSTCAAWNLEGRPDAYDKSGQRLLKHYDYLKYMRGSDGRPAMSDAVGRLLIRNWDIMKPATSGNSGPPSPMAAETSILPQTKPIQHRSISASESTLSHINGNQPTQRNCQLDRMNNVDGSPPHPMDECPASHIDVQDPPSDEAQVYSRPRGGQQRLFRGQLNVIRVPELAPPPPSPKNFPQHEISTYNHNQGYFTRDQYSPISQGHFHQQYRPNQQAHFGNMADDGFFGVQPNMHYGGVHCNPANHVSAWNNLVLPVQNSTSGPPPMMGIYPPNLVPVRPSPPQTQGPGHVRKPLPRNDSLIWKPILTQSHFEKPRPVRGPRSGVDGGQWWTPIIQPCQFQNQYPVGGAGQFQQGGDPGQWWTPNIPSPQFYNQHLVVDPMLIQQGADTGPWWPPNIQAPQFPNQHLACTPGPIQHGGDAWQPGMPCIHNSGQSEIGQISELDPHNEQSRSHAQLNVDNVSNTSTPQISNDQAVNMGESQSSSQSSPSEQAQVVDRSQVDDQRGEFEQLLYEDEAVLETNFSIDGDKDEQVIGLGLDDDLFGESCLPPSTNGQDDSQSADDGRDLRPSNMPHSEKDLVGATGYSSPVTMTDEAVVAPGERRKVMTVSPISAMSSNATLAPNADCTHQTSFSETFLQANVQRAKKTPPKSVKASPSKVLKPVLKPTGNSSTPPRALRSAALREKELRRQKNDKITPSTMDDANAAACIAVGGRRKSWDTGHHTPTLPSRNREIIELSDNETEDAVVPVKFNKTATIQTTGITAYEFARVQPIDIDSVGAAPSEFGLDEAGPAGERLDDDVSADGLSNGFLGMTMEQEDSLFDEESLRLALEAALERESTEPRSASQDRVTQSSSVVDHATEESDGDLEYVDESEESEEE